MTTEKAGMLAGYRVLDLTRGGALLCGRLLADLGADVIAVEPPEGNPSRYRAPYAQDRQGPEDSLYWFAYGANKRSVTLDLQSESGRESFRQLVGTTDVVLESFPPDYLSGLGLGYDALAEHHPHLIMTSITPFGQTGPRRHYRATDLVMMSLGGSVYLTGEPGREPLCIGVPQAELHAGVEAGVATLVALHDRHHRGEGQHIDVAVQSCVVWTLMNAAHFAALGQATRQRFGAWRESLPGPRRMIFPCRDGYVSAAFFGGPFGAQACRRLVQWMTELGRAPAFMPDIDWDTWDDVWLAELGDEGRQEIERVEQAVAAFFAPFTMRELYEQALDRRLMLAPVAHAQMIDEDSQLAAREFFVWHRHAGLGKDLPLPGPFAKCRPAPLHVQRPAPQLGEHNVEILGEVLGAERGQAPAEALTQPAVHPYPPLPQPGERLTAVPRPTPQRDQQPLRHVRVLDLTWYATGPIGTKYLADHGAEVIKVESALRPDGLRQAPPWQGSYDDLNSSQFFANYNTGKRSISLNLATTEARQLVKRLVREWADVVVESFTPGTMAKWGLDYNALRRLKPNLIMLSTCMQGQTGPHAHYAGFGNMLASLCGFYHVTGYPDSGPMPVYGAYTDFVACRFVGLALLAALSYRRRTGEGQYIDLSQYEASLHLLAPTLLDYAANGNLAERQGNRHATAAPHGVYRCKGEDRWCAIAVTTEEEWQAFCAVLGHPAWTRRRRFATLAARLQHVEQLDRRVEAWTQTLPSLTVMTLLQEAGVPAGVVQNGADLYRDPQLHHRGFFVDLEHARMGWVLYEGHQFHLSTNPGALWSPAPLLGEHTHVVLRDLLRLPAVEIARLEAQGVLA
ncbi:CaiB/BaiF CoA transferase family protein [Candidatus Entotheonella palauensis]|uniref:CaiB/BaiF CoA transferase family protein n=1 Tax=Candidatus Entotheonella palauensis TaxID=93172 RepID=UPI0015C4B70D|nr:CoA transferase [Candidatus Entotheonella palauensis]